MAKKILYILVNKQMKYICVIKKKHMLIILLKKKTIYPNEQYESNKLICWVKKNKYKIT